ncbi:basic proline-rich protein-like [Tachyglossus aculeatus]|uniref:basic proline-rich protein-like n=1 Tax=Tachyglossus aculeatus TaxID=9261 RepID=UPI0018F324CD|nr:basic proline-rich protein-like [Tachyglossus aculeatus]
MARRPPGPPPDRLRARGPDTPTPVPRHPAPSSRGSGRAASGAGRPAHRRRPLADVHVRHPAPPRTVQSGVGAPPVTTPPTGLGSGGGGSPLTAGPHWPTSPSRTAPLPGLPNQASERLVRPRPQAGDPGGRLRGRGRPSHRRRPLVDVHVRHPAPPRPVQSAVRPPRRAAPPGRGSGRAASGAGRPAHRRRPFVDVHVRHPAPSRTAQSGVGAPPVTTPRSRSGVAGGGGEAPLSPPAPIGRRPRPAPRPFPDCPIRRRSASSCRAPRPGLREGGIRVGAPRPPPAPIGRRPRPSPRPAPDCPIRRRSAPRDHAPKPIWGVGAPFSPPAPIGRRPRPAPRPSPDCPIRSRSAPPGHAPRKEGAPGGWDRVKRAPPTAGAHWPASTSVTQPRPIRSRSASPGHAPKPVWGGGEAPRSPPVPIGRSPRPSPRPVQSGVGAPRPRPQAGSPGGRVRGRGAPPTDGAYWPTSTSVPIPVQSGVGAPHLATPPSLSGVGGEGCLARRRRPLADVHVRPLAPSNQASERLSWPRPQAGSPGGRVRGWGSPLTADAYWPTSTPVPPAPSNQVPARLAWPRPQAGVGVGSPVIAGAHWPTSTSVAPPLPGLANQASERPPATPPGRVSVRGGGVGGRG